jgi:hypothetical protein
MRVGQSRKRDDGEAAIVQALEDIGVSVVALSTPGCPDLLVWSRRDGFRLLEVKAPKGKLTPQQVLMRTKVPFTVVRSVAESLALFGVKA